jgi:5'-nucleotidase
VLLVDAGDYAHPTLTHEDQENWFILKAMGQMRYDAMTLGELELYRGAKYVQAILDSTRIPVTVANARFTATKTMIGKPYILTSVGDLTYGIIGLIGQDFGEGKEKLVSLGFTVDDPFEIAARMVPEVRKQADLVVVLAHLGSADAFQLPKSVKGIDVVVFGHYPGTVAPTQVEGAVTVRPGQRGQYLGETRVVLSPENKVVSYSGEAVALDVKKIGEEPRIAAELKALKKALGKPETPQLEPEDPRSAVE